MARPAWSVGCINSDLYSYTTRLGSNFPDQLLPDHVMVNERLLDVSPVIILILIHEIEGSIFSPVTSFVEIWSIHSLNKLGSDFLTFELLPRFSFVGMVGFRRGHNVK